MQRLNTLEFITFITNNIRLSDVVNMFDVSVIVIYNGTKHGYVFAVLPVVTELRLNAYTCMNCFDHKCSEVFLIFTFIDFIL